jgi:hypothetical protein
MVAVRYVGTGQACSLRLPTHVRGDHAKPADTRPGGTPTPQSHARARSRPTAGNSPDVTFTALRGNMNRRRLRGCRRISTPRFTKAREVKVSGRRTERFVCPVLLTVRVILGQFRQILAQLVGVVAVKEYADFILLRTEG